MDAKILIVDDEPDVCEVISHYLNKRGYNIDTATSGQEALSKVVSEKPALILLDIRMPDMDGIECLRRIKELDKSAIVIMVTYVTDIETAKKAMELGAADYFTKPLGFSALENAITTYLFIKSAS